MGITKRFEIEFSDLTYELNRAQKEVVRARTGRQMMRC
jgi:hypothetical protein